MMLKIKKLERKERSVVEWVIALSSWLKLVLTFQII